MEEKKCPACGYKSSHISNYCDSCDCPLEAKPTKEECNIYKEVSKRRKRAEELGLPELFGKLYLDQIKYIPSWYRDNPENVCSLITNAQRIEDNHNKIKVTLKGHDYIFEFKQDSCSLPDGAILHTGNLLLYAGDKKVLAVSMSMLVDDDTRFCDPEWGSFQAKVFIEGDWIKDFQELKKRIPIEDAERNKKRAAVENSEKLKKLKEDFEL